MYALSRIVVARRPVRQPHKPGDYGTCALKLWDNSLAIALPPTRAQRLSMSHRCRPRLVPPPIADRIT